MTANPSERRLVLLIDDDDLVVGSLRHYLTTQGCDVDVAVEPSAADALMRSKHYDVVMIDPYFTGAIHDEHSILDSIGMLQPNAVTIVLTAYPSPVLERSVTGGRPTAVLAKPQSVVYLSELVGAARAVAPLSTRDSDSQPSFKGHDQ